MAGDFESIDDVQRRLAEVDYVCGRGLATVVFLSLKLGRASERQRLPKQSARYWAVS